MKHKLKNFGTKFNRLKTEEEKINGKSMFEILSNFGPCFILFPIRILTFPKNKFFAVDTMNARCIMDK